MAGEQGTGKHPHKSAADPKEHHEAKETHTAKSTGKKGSVHDEEAEGQGTGKHPHKKAADPKEHHEGAKK